MKTISTLLALLAMVLVYQPSEAQAGRYDTSIYTYVSGYASCGCPLYTKRVFARYDRYGRPVYTYYSQPIVHRCGQGAAIRVQYGNYGYYRNYYPYYYYRGHRSHYQHGGYRHHRHHSHHRDSRRHSHRR
ncbi:MULTISPECIES: hypothetical protein [Rubritalea]|uniref:hypothetical protein n=1 Tax=Rubritalea TaxID=361050 RepID=UPI0011604508|nr:hypothetical protein [Rubritalea squalenifaciens]